MYQMVISFGTMDTVATLVLQMAIICDAVVAVVSHNVCHI